ncbi:MAG: phenylalanine--tRNA ligase subunit beta [Elusimicrobiota bacterium]
MKISYSWLKDFIPLEIPPEELAEHLLLIGFEVEDITRIGPDFTGVVVGEVLTVEKHPNADRLSLCEVSVGDRKFAVVCGAPNVAAGQRVPLAPVGAKLRGGLKVKKAKIRGAVSQGMICSAKELGLAEETHINGIHVLPQDCALGADFRSVAGEADAVLDVDITPNRPDCLSHLGLARELCVYFDLPLTPLKAAPFDEGGPESLPIFVSDPAECPRYQGRLIEDVRIAPSPSWLAKRLEAVGLRPINNIADITNYVLFESGQPLHAFDADLLKGGRIDVRSARAGEKIRALDGKEYALSTENLVIADAERTVAVAGVIGGEATGVTQATRRVFLECAYFRPGRVRRSARLLGVRTDSSYRFERGADIGGIPAAAARAASLIVSLAGGAAGAPADTNPSPPERSLIRVSARRVNEILGADYPAGRVEGVLDRLSARCERSPDGLAVAPPSYRHDLTTEWDLAEEAARHLGYGAIPYETSPVRIPEPETLPLNDCAGLLRGRLGGLGFWEACNYDFVSEAELERFLGRAAGRDDHPRLLNPISEEWAVLRPSLLIGLLRNAALNFNRGAAGLRLFEIGRVYAKQGAGIDERTRAAGIMAGAYPVRAHWKRGGEAPDFFDIKGMVETALRGYRVGWRASSAPDGVFHPRMHLELLLDDPHGKQPPRVCGRAGLLHPDLVKRWDLAPKGVPGLGTAPAGRSREVAAFELDAGLLSGADVRAAGFRPFSAFPTSGRDLSVVVGENLAFEAVAACVRRLDLAELRRLELIDVFTGDSVEPGKKSLTLRITFSRADRTLRDAEIQAAVDRILSALRAECGAALRG